MSSYYGSVMLLSSWFSPDQNAALKTGVWKRKQDSVPSLLAKMLSHKNMDITMCCVLTIGWRVTTEQFWLLHDWPWVLLPPLSLPWLLKTAAGVLAYQVQSHQSHLPTCSFLVWHSPSSHWAHVRWEQRLTALSSGEKPAALLAGSSGRWDPIWRGLVRFYWMPLLCESETGKVHERKEPQN